MNISIAIHPIEQAFHLDDIEFGWVFSAWVIGYALFQAPSGRMADRFGPRRILALGTIWRAVFTALTPLVPSNFRGSLIVLVAARAFCRTVVSAALLRGAKVSGSIGSACRATR